MPVTINGTTGIAGPDGSASTPAVQGTDSNTGLFFPAANEMAITANGSVAANFPAGVTFGFKNRIINGGMVIDQRNAGASVTANDGIFTVDRFRFFVAQTGKGTSQQSTTAPAGFTNSLLFTSSSSYSVLSTDYFDIAQTIEGLNIADFAWGTASAASVTLSFRVYSSLTGTFGGSLNNSGNTRSYPFSYSIPVANTWTTVSVTIPGDTAGTWLSTNGVGIRIFWSLGAGSTLLGSSSAWGSTDYRGGLTGATSVVGTNGATFYITGVQLEIGTQATAFDWRPYGTELMLCQRYYWKFTASAYAAPGLAYDTTAFIISGIQNPVPMRADPTLTIPSASSSFTGLTGNGSSPSSYGSYSTEVAKTQYVGIRGTGFSASFTVGQVCYLSGNGTQHLQVSAEL